MATKKRNSHFGVKTAKVTYKWNGTDSAGVANSTVTSHGTGVYIPSGAIVTNAFYNVTETFQSGAASDNATIALTLQSAGDLKAGIAIATAGDVWDLGLHGCLPGSYAEAVVAGDTAVLDAARKAASYILLTAEREIVVTVGIEALTVAGEMDIMVEYYVP